MAFSFRYKPVNLSSGKIYRPLIPLTFNGKESIDIFGLLDSGSDMTIIPADMAEAIGINLENEISGISGSSIKAWESFISLKFGKGHEIYEFKIPVLVPQDTEYSKIIIGRQGFFNQFKIIFIENEKRIEFKKDTNLNYLSNKV